MKKIILCVTRKLLKMYQNAHKSIKRFESITNLLRPLVSIPANSPLSLRVRDSKCLKLRIAEARLSRRNEKIILTSLATVKIFASTHGCPLGDNRVVIILYESHKRDFSFPFMSYRLMIYVYRRHKNWLEREGKALILWNTGIN